MSVRIPGLLLLLGASRVAQGFEGQAPTEPPPSTGDQPATTVASPAGPLTGTWSAQVGLGVAGSPLVQTVTDGADPVRSCALCSVGELRLAGQYALSDRVALGLTAPLHPWASGGDTGSAALGDLALWVPLTLRRGPGLEVALRPFLSLPTGPADRYLGAGSVGGGSLVTAGVHRGRLWAVAELGVDVAGRDVLGTATLPTGLALHGEVLEGWALGGELRGRVTPSVALPPAQELLGSMRWRLGPTVLRLAGGRGLTSAPGAAAWRVKADLAWSPVAEGPEVPRIVQPITYRLTAPDGTPVRNAAVFDDGAVLARSDYLGRLELTPDQATLGLAAEAPGYLDQVLPRPPTPAPDGNQAPVDLVMPFRPVPVEVRVVDASGQPLDAAVTLRADDEPLTIAADALGTYTTEALAGLWTLTTAAEGYTAQERTLVIEGGRMEPLRIDAVLAPAAADSELLVTVTDVDGDPVEGAFLQLGERLLGTTGSGGDLSVSDLAAGPQKLVARHPAYEEAEPLPVVLGRDTERAVVILNHLPGTVEVRVEGPDGRPTPATIALTGPDAMMRPIDTGIDGRHEWRLTEGEWSFDIHAPGLGRQTRHLRVDHSERSLQVVQVRLQPDVGPASLAVRAIDANGLPVRGAEVRVGGAGIGRTGSDGSLVVEGLAVGPTQLVVAADRVKPYALDLQLTEARREVDALLDWLPGTVRVRALGPDGQPVAGEVRATDGEQTVSGVLDIDGRWVDQLPPGEWEVLVSVASLGLQTRSVRVEADRTTLLTVDFRLAEVAGDASLALTVERPDGSRVEGARLLVDDQDFGTSGSGGEARLASLARGPRRVRVEAPGLETVETTIELGAREIRRTVVLPWAEGVVDLTIVAGDAPVTDAVLRLAGPTLHPPVGTDAEGQARVALSPGTWTLLVSSVAAGLHQQEIDVPGGTEPTALRIALERVGTATLLVRVHDEDGRPIPDAEVVLSPGAALRTSSGGAALFTALLPGAATLEVDAPEPLLDRQLPVDVPDGSEQLTVQVRWPRSPVAFQTVDAEGGPVVADLLLQGRTPLPVHRTGADGRTELELRPGAWRAWARAGELEGADTFDVSVEASPEVRIELVDDELEQTAGRFRFDEAVLFGIGQADLRPEANPAVDALAARLRDDPSILLAEVQGHTDDTGPLAVNLPLSERRAQTVLDALVARGVPAERLRARGYAMLRPVVPGRTSEARAQNRRVEVVVIERAVR